MKTDKWISVNDRLPEDFEEVLVWARLTDTSPMRRYVGQYMRIDRHRDCWTARGVSGPGVYVSRWMPLPDPPDN